MIANARDFGKLLLIIVGFMFAGEAGAADTQTPPTAEGKPILTISGKIAPPAGGTIVQLDRASFEALGMVTIETKTPWYPGPVKFEGVPLEKLMTIAGATGKIVTAVALNDYSSDIPIDDFSKYHPILAIKRNGEYMPVSDKGPLFVIYPFDSDSELQSKRFYSRAVWQVTKLVVN
jgi:hypothetical protein